MFDTISTPNQFKLETTCKFLISAFLEELYKFPNETICQCIVLKWKT